MRNHRPPRLPDVVAPEPPFHPGKTSAPPQAPPVQAPLETLPPPASMDCTPMITGLLRGRKVDPGVVALVCRDEVLRQRMRRDLEEQGHRVLAAPSGPALIPLLGSSTPAVVLMDERVVDPEPFELCSVVRDDPSLSDIAVLLITHRASVDARRVPFHAGARDLLHLPYLRSELCARVGLRLELQRSKQEREAADGQELAAG